MIPPVCLRRRHQSGIALILVLSILVLLTAVVIAFFTNATTDLTSSKGYSNEAQVKLLANSAVNVVEGQIRAATAGTDAKTTGTIAWASQPGLIRTYDNNGNNVAQYKLYSSDELQVRNGDANGEFPFSPTTAASTEIPNNWNTLPSDFTDLNSPEVIPDPNGTLSDANGVKYSARFPIIDGNNLGTVSGVNGMTYVNSNGTQTIAGFNVQTPTTFNPGAPAPVIAPTNNPVPMPVRWLYQLQNGELNPRDPTTGNITDAGATNPVVGRIAFWTDDDTCKLNVNTASEATAWDPPRAKTTTDVKDALYIPAQNEFQMYPGHPATTCLSTVFGSKWPIPTAGIVNTTSDYDLLLPYYDLVPRVTSGLNNSATNTQGSAGAIQTPSANGIIYDADRLYTSVDELMFNTGTNTSTTPATRPARNLTSNIAGGADPSALPLTPAFLETSRFFLTTSNRAPEVTLFNTPRISLWPIQTQPAARTAKDALLAFCSTIPANGSSYSAANVATGYQYYFQRLTPGTATPASCASTTMDWTLRNQQLYQYLQNLSSQPVPGLGGTFSGKYPAGANQQLLTEIFDQIRSGVNTVNSNSNASFTSGTYGERQIVPLVPPANTPGAGTQGFGRFPTITEAAIDLFLVSAPAGAPIQIGAVLILQPFNVSPGFPNFSPQFQVEVSGLNGFTIAPYPSDTPAVKLGFNADDYDVINTPIGFMTTGGATEYNTLMSMFSYNNNGAAAKLMTTGGLNNPNIFPFFNSQITNDPRTVGIGNLPNGTTQFDLNPAGTATIIVKIYPYLPNQLVAGSPIQTLTLQFPTAHALPLPTNTATGSVQGFKNRFFKNDGFASDPLDEYPGAGSGLIDPGDVVRSVIVKPTGPSGGDLRVIAALNNVPASYFTTHPFYDNYKPGTTPQTAPGIDPNTGQDTYNWRFAESLRTGESPGWGELGYAQYGGSSTYYIVPIPSPGAYRRPAFTGSLVANLPVPAPGVPPYLPEAAPAVPVGTKAAYMSDGVTPGDWDTGIGILEDGPYINKPDEGNQTNANQGAAQYNRSPYFNRGYFAGVEGGATYSPNRQIASAVAFGSLPTGITQNAPTQQPWQTLLFCAYPPAFVAENGTLGNTGRPPDHPGFGTTVKSSQRTSLGLPLPPYVNTPDHVMLDLFTMPIVEPYAISEPLSTQGKVNMNYQIAPFTYIRRDTALQAVLKGTKMMAIPISAAQNNYKTQNRPTTTQYRYSINPDEKTGTLAAFEERFNGGSGGPPDIFRSASEICTVPLVPSQDAGQSYDPNVPVASYSPSAMQQFWNSCQLTGDNLREEPYGDLYARLTTKSNSFTVHVRVQTLKKSAGTNVATFIDPNDTTVTGAKDTITGEYRGSFQIERYVDPSVTTVATGTTPGFPDYVTAFPNSNPTPISTFYKFHTIGTKQF